MARRQRIAAVVLNRLAGQRGSPEVLNVLVLVGCLEPAAGGPPGLVRRLVVPCGPLVAPG